MRTFGQCFIVLTFATAISGCATGPITFVGEECEGGVEPGSSEWWAEKALLPPGVRQKCYKGKMWPPRPRPTVERQQFSHTYHSAHYWPLPYICQDRQYVKDIIGVQRQLGWQQETTLYARHFDEEQNLTVPGRLHLIDIMEVTPMQYRTIYVQSAYNTDLDNARMANVQQTLLELTEGRDEIPVLLRKGRDYNRPASEVKIINDLYNTSIPTPRIGAGGGGGGSAGGGAALGP